MKRFTNYSMMAFLILGLAVGCGSSKKKEQATDTLENAGDTTGSGELELNGDSDSNRAGGLRTVYFAYDSSDLNSSARSTLDSNAQILKGTGSVKVQIEGHCDERGGIQYNLALGEKRARATKEYLVGQGIASDRIDIVSYGKERPLEYGTTEAAWSKNRRGNFVITAK